VGSRDVKAKLKTKVVFELALSETSRRVPVLIPDSFLQEIENELSELTGCKSDCNSWSKIRKFSANVRGPCNGEAIINN